MVAVFIVVVVVVVIDRCAWCRRTSRVHIVVVCHCVALIVVYLQWPYTHNKQQTANNKEEGARDGNTESIRRIKN